MTGHAIFWYNWEKLKKEGISHDRQSAITTGFGRKHSNDAGIGPELSDKDRAANKLEACGRKVTASVLPG
jgi:hypothetical protein